MKNNIKAKYFLIMMALFCTILLSACGESATTSAPTAEATAAASTTPASPETTSASQSTAAATAQASQTTASITTEATGKPAPTTKSSGSTSGKKIAKVNACELFNQQDAETALGVKVEQTASKDNTAYYTCFYNTFNDGKLKLKDISFLSVLVFTNEVTPSWYASVKRENEAQSSSKSLTPVAGVGSDAFSYVVTNTASDSKSVHLAVVKDKTYFLIAVNNAKMNETEQAAQLKTLASKIASRL